MMNGELPRPGQVAGKVELAEGIPAVGATVGVRGTSSFGKSDNNGLFRIRNLPAGGWTLRVIHPLATEDTLWAVGVNEAEVTNTGVIRLKTTGSIRGRLVFLNPDDQATAVVAVPEQGIATQPNAAGGYLLEGIAAGTREVVFLPARVGSAVARKVAVLVKAHQTVDGPDYVERGPEGPDTIDFGTVILGSSPQSIWTLANPDAISATLDSVTISGAGAQKFQLGALPPLPATISPTGLELPLVLDGTAQGTFTAELQIEGTAEGVGFAQSAAITAVVAPPPNVPVPVPKVVPAELKFGSLPGVGALPVELRNEGDAAGNFSIAMSFGPFHVINPPFPLSIQAHAAQQFTVQAVSPGQPGAVSGLIRFLCEPGNKTVDLKVTASWT